MKPIHSKKVAKAMIKISNNTEIKLQRNSINQILPKNTLDHLK